MLVENTTGRVFGMHNTYKSLLFCTLLGASSLFFLLLPLSLSLSLSLFVVAHHSFNRLFVCHSQHCTSRSSPTYISYSHTHTHSLSLFSFCFVFPPNRERWAAGFDRFWAIPGVSEDRRVRVCKYCVTFCWHWNDFGVERIHSLWRMNSYNKE